MAFSRETEPAISIREVMPPAQKQLLFQCVSMRLLKNGLLKQVKNLPQRQSLKKTLQKSRKKSLREPYKKPEEKPEENPTKKPEENNDDDPDSDTVTYRVVFMDRDRRVQSYTVKAGEPLSKTPPDSKTSKDGYIFTGWFSDMEYTKPFYADDPVTSDLTVYAKYEEIVKKS